MAFLGIRLPEALVARMSLELLIQGYPELKWTKPNDLHVTLRFFPEGGVPKLERLIETMQTYRTPIAPFEFEIGGAGTFDREKSGGVLWLGLATYAPSLLELQRELEALARSLGYPPETRPFNPHITIARYRSDDRAKIADVIKAINTYPDFHQRFKAEGFSLMKRSRSDDERVYQDLLVSPLNLNIKDKL